MRKMYLVAVAALALSLTAFGLTNKTLGLSRQGPDESKVQTNEPLVLPPEYNVRPKTSIAADEE